MIGCIVDDSITNLETINFNNRLDTRKVTTLEGLFSNNKKLTAIQGLETWDTGNVESMHLIFRNCTLLFNIDFLKKWNTSKNTSLQTAFFNCTISDLSPLASWDVSKVTNMIVLFADYVNINRCWRT